MRRSFLERRPRAAAPGARGTPAGEGVPAAAAPQGAVGPELIEQALSRQAQIVANTPPCAPNRLNGRPAGIFTGDAGTPQHFVPHPTIGEIVSDTSTTNVPAPGTLPGRVPQGVWDGEPGASAPTMA